MLCSYIVETREKEMKEGKKSIALARREEGNNGTVGG
jgi:hypothetical protein